MAAQRDVAAGRSLGELVRTANFVLCPYRSQVEPVAVVDATWRAIEVRRHDYDDESLDRLGLEHDPNPEDVEALKAFGIAGEVSEYDVAHALIATTYLDVASASEHDFDTAKDALAPNLDLRHRELLARLTLAAARDASARFHRAQLEQLRELSKRVPGEPAAFKEILQRHQRRAKARHRERLGEFAYRSAEVALPVASETACRWQRSTARAPRRRNVRAGPRRARAPASEPGDDDPHELVLDALGVVA